MEAEEEATSYLTLPTLASFSAELGDLKDKINALESDFRDSMTSALNREERIRNDIDNNMRAMEDIVMTNLKHFEEQLVGCLQRRDEKRKAEIQRLKSQPCCFSRFF